MEVSAVETDEVGSFGQIAASDSEDFADVLFLEMGDSIFQR